MKQVSFAAMYYEAKQKPSPLQVFLDEVSRITHRSPSVVRLWVYGNQVPDRLCVETIALHFGVDPNGLFPKPAQTESHG